MPLFKSAARHFKISQVAELAFDKACGPELDTAPDSVLDQGARPA